MTIVELMPEVQALPRLEKLRLVQFLIGEIIREEETLPFEPGVSWPAWSPRNTVEAAVTLQDLSDQEKHGRQQPLPMPDSSQEMQWLVDHAREYKKQWVALDGDRLIAHGDHDQVWAAAQADGAYLPLIHCVEDPDNTVSIIWA